MARFTISVCRSTVDLVIGARRGPQDLVASCPVKMMSRLGHPQGQAKDAQWRPREVCAVTVAASLVMVAVHFCSDDTSEL